MHWSFHMLFQHSFQHALQISTCTEIFNIVFNTCTEIFNIVFSTEIFNIVFNMHYRFQYALKFSTGFFNMLQHIFQHGLQISTCITDFRFQISTCITDFRFWISTCIRDFNMCWNFQHAFSRCFQHISNMKFTYGMNHVENCVENRVKYFKACWKPCQKFQVCQKSPWCDHYMTLSINFET